MKKWRIVLILFICCTFCSQALAASPIWQITSGRYKIYIGGTIHVLAEADFPLPRVFDRAYKKADILVFETDIGKTAEPEFSSQVMELMTYPGQTTLKSKLSAGTYADLTAFSTERGIEVHALNKFKPGMIMAVLTLAEGARAGAVAAGVDERFYIQGQKDNKPMQFLEAPMAQISFLSQIGIGKEDEMIAYILKDIGSLKDLLPVMKKAWRTGNNKLMFDATLAPLKAEYPDLYATMMVDRNLAWLPAIEKMLKTPETEFILVGAAHLAGDQGLIRLLKQKGFRVKNW